MDCVRVLEDGHDEALRVLVAPLVDREIGVMPAETSLEPGRHPALSGLFQAVRVKGAILAQRGPERLAHELNLPRNRGGRSRIRSDALPWTSSGWGG